MSYLKITEIPASDKIGPLYACSIGLLSNSKDTLTQWCEFLENQQKSEVYGGRTFVLDIGKPTEDEIRLAKEVITS